MIDAQAKEVPSSILSDTLVSIGGILMIAVLTAGMYFVTVGL